MIKNFTLAIIFFAIASAAFCLDFNARLEPDPRLDSSIFSVAEIQAEPFARAALVASGADEESVKKHLDGLDSHWKQVSPQLNDLETAEDKADKILFFIYEKFLSKYDFYQTRVDLAMESGVYNCVSSAILFMYFCKRAGIPVVANETPRHSFCTIYDGSDKIDVETTNPYGVNPGKTRAQVLANGKTQWMTVPAKDYAGRHQIDDRRMIGIVYCNRISQLQKKKLDDKTVGLAVDAYEVQGHSPVSRNELEIAIGNASGLYSKAAREQDAIDFLLKAQEIFGPCQNWTMRLYTNHYNMVLAKAKTLPFEQGLAQVEAYKENLTAKDYADLKEFVYLLGGQVQAKKYNWRAAIKIVQDGLAQLPQSKMLLNNKKIYMGNMAVDFHNAAVDLYNAGQKDKAIEKLKEGLQEVPGDRTLQNDLNRMSK